MQTTKKWKSAASSSAHSSASAPLARATAGSRREPTNTEYSNAVMATTSATGSSDTARTKRLLAGTRLSAHAVATAPPSHACTHGHVLVVHAQHAEAANYPIVKKLARVIFYF